jgi:hypothetical protein
MWKANGERLGSLLVGEVLAFGLVTLRCGWGRGKRITCNHTWRCWLGCIPPLHYCLSNLSMEALWLGKREPKRLACAIPVIMASLKSNGGERLTFRK